MKRPIILLILILALFAFASILLSGCRPASRQRTTSTATTTTAIAPTTSTTAKEEITLTLYFVKSQDGVMFLVPESRSIPKTKAVAKAAVEELIKGPTQPGHISVIPRNTKVLSVKIKNGLATVDFSKEVLNANVGSDGEELGIAQVVDTLTEFPTISKVKFLVEGRDKGKIDGREIQDWWGHVGLSGQPFSRNESLIQGGVVRTNAITVDLPRAFTVASSPLTVKGKVTVFEARFNVRVLDKNNNVLADQPITAQNFENGPFEETVSFSKPSIPGRGTVLFYFHSPIYFHSPKDGSEVTLASVTVFFE